MICSYIFVVISKPILHLVVQVTNKNVCHHKLVVPWVLTAFVHWLPRLPSVILLFALIVECLDRRACDSRRVAVLAVQSCGDFEGVQTIGHSYGGQYLLYITKVYSYRRITTKKIKPKLAH